MEEPIVTARRKALEQAMEDYPMMGEFTAGQYAQEALTTGSVYVPGFKRHVKFTNIKSKHYRLYFRAFRAAENAQATREGRPIDTEKIIAYGEYLLANLNGWAANMYNRVTGVFEGLRASPTPSSKPSWRERRAMKRQGGW